MGYTRVVQYGNTTEVYEYERPLVRTQKQNHVKIQRLIDKTCKNHILIHSVLKKDSLPITSTKTAIYTRTDSSINRTLRNFFRLVHHNVTYSNTTHFVTLTFIDDIPYAKALNALKRFIRDVQAAQSQVPIRYISVPEKTKNDRWHFHILCFDLLPHVSGIPKINKKNKPYGTTERDTRYLQNIFGKGYLDIRPTTYKTKGIAGYMAKYMSKSFKLSEHQSMRNYNASRNINKVTSHGSNTLDKDLEYILPTENTLEIKKKLYTIPYLGKCINTRITTIIN